ncbi:MAG: type II toxin-antitoxin system RelE/ParE family toxin [Terracidiphilus sp.]
MFTPGTENKWEAAFHPDYAPEVLEVSDAVRREIYSLFGLLRRLGPQLGRPQADTLKGSKHANMKELRFCADNGVWRVAFAFDSKRRAILLVGGDKAGVSKDKFYRHLIEVADRRFDQHQRVIEPMKEKQ